LKTDIVFIDDEEDILNLVRLRFRKIAKLENVQLHLFSKSVDFEEYIKGTDAEVVSIISDINMPNNNVLPTLDDERGKFRFALAYLCSAYDQEEYQEMINNHDIQFFFKKPLNIDFIKERIMNDLNERGIRF
jgi:DNA-binding NtrC family response regulator